MKKYLLPNEGTFFKANLHSHSTFSDGALTPAEMKAVYQAQGYSIVAYTDHDLMFHHRELNDNSFLALSGFEIYANQGEMLSYSINRNKYINPSSFND